MPKSSIAIRTPSALIVVSRRAVSLDVAHQGRLGDLNRQRLGVQAALGERMFDVGDQLVGVELACGDVDGDPDRMTGSTPVRALRAGLVEDPAARCR